MEQTLIIEDPFKRYISFLIERDAIYTRKTRGDPWPWTEDKILQTYRFTEIYRERDRTSLHYQKAIRERYKDSALVLPATVLYRWFNRIETCDALFNEPELDNKTVFERFIDKDCKDINVLFDAIKKIPPPHVTGAFIITGKQGFEKGLGVMLYFYEWCKKPWQNQWGLWQINPPTLQEMFNWLKKDSHGLGSFMAAQLVADLKYLPFMKDVSDWWTWASSGPGSQRGLNILLGRPMNQSWNEKEWLERIQDVREAENKELVPLGLGPFHAQDTQNHNCEWSKYTKVLTGVGRPRQVYRV